MAAAGADPLIFFPRFAGAITTLPIIEAAAQGNGSVNYLPFGPLSVLTFGNGRVQPSLYDSFSQNRSAPRRHAPFAVATRTV